MTAARVAIVHDYLTQFGGAERVVLALTRAFPGATVHTAFYEPGATFPEFRDLDIRPLPINRIAPLRHRHRLALPFLATAFSRARIDADIVVCSSSGWAHGASSQARKVVYCHNPAHWLYLSDEYVAPTARVTRAALGAIGPPLRRWDRRAAASAARYLVNSTAIRERVRSTYGIDAEVLHPPPALSCDGPRQPVAGLQPGFALCVSRLVAYKNVRAAVDAFTLRPSSRLVVVGEGPQRADIERAAPRNVRMLGTVSDAELRWLYDECAVLVAPAYEDFGITPVEAAAFGTPTLALRFGGYLDTVTDGTTGLFFDTPEPDAISDALDRFATRRWDADVLRARAEGFAERRFVARMRAVVAEEADRAGLALASP